MSIGQSLDLPQPETVIADESGLLLNEVVTVVMLYTVEHPVHTL